MSRQIYVLIVSYGIALLLFKGCQSFFLRNHVSGHCITTVGNLRSTKHKKDAYTYAMMGDSCLEKNAQFRYLSDEKLQNIESTAILVSPYFDKYERCWIIYYSEIADKKLNYQNRREHRLKQTPTGSLSFYNRLYGPVCAEPNSTAYIKRKQCTDIPQQKFTLGSVTRYGAKTKDVHCSSKQFMVIKRADYGDFDKSGRFDYSAGTSFKCSKFTNCKMKSFCNGNRSCSIIFDENLLAPEYCSDAKKQIFTEYTCTDSYKSPVFPALNVRLTKLYKGFIEVYDGSTWWKVNDENWDKVRRNMLCKHLGFEVNGNNESMSLDIPSGQKIATGDVMCYTTRLNGTSCCMHLQPFITTSSTSITNVNCQICDKPIITGQNTFPQPTFSGNGTSDYTLARMDKRGWCSGNGDEYLEIDLQKEYNIFQIVVAADENPTKWSGSYSLKYSRNTSYENSVKITGNKNGYQAASTFVDIRNVRYIKIKSTDKQEFCLRIELCEPRDAVTTSSSGIGVALGVSIGVFFALVAILVVAAVIIIKRRRAQKQETNVEMFSVEYQDNESDDFESYASEEKFFGSNGCAGTGSNERIYLNESTGNAKENRHPPVPLAEFLHYVNELKANDNYMFGNEYNDLPKDFTTSWEVSKRPFNKDKNRYGNIVTYDYCRVVLSGDENEDYINASYIDGISANSYIACQGPTPVTVNDMWKMVWEQRSYSIVMVTSLNELGTRKPKCEKYWPDEGSKMYGDIEVTLEKTEIFAFSETHTLQIRKGDEKREVRHYYFKSWPDHSVPKYPTELLAFRNHYRTHHVKQSGPIIVHCSAGVGRTGVFIAIDTILDKLEKGVVNCIDVFGEVSSMRERRMNMVQTLEQYIFVYEAIMETIVCGMNEVDCCNIKEEIGKLAETKPSGLTGFQEKFKTLEKVSPILTPDECIAGLLEENGKKNRVENVYPGEGNRVTLEYLDGVQNSDYINAVFVDSYTARNHFIATQSPLPNTINDFWRLVFSQKSSTIVLLNSLQDGTAFPIFWPTTMKEKPIQYGSLTVQFNSEWESNGIWTREFVISPYPDLQDCREVKIFHYTKWPHHGVPRHTESVVNLLSLVENSWESDNQGPIIVACSDGAGRTGTFIAISNLLERMKVDQKVDVFQAIKIIRGSRPQFVENSKQYRFCYLVIMAYQDSSACVKT